MRTTLTTLLLIMFLTGCVSQNDRILAGGNAVELRSYQSRAFDMTDEDKMLRTIIATLQDLNFIVDKADDELGIISATKLSGYTIRMTITCMPRGTTQIVIRANATYNLKAIEDPAPYQDFYTSLGKALFLTAHQID